jgi:ATP-binding cassette subfamily B protein
MSENNSSMNSARPRRPMGGGRFAPGEKPKNFKHSMKKLISYLGTYKIAIFIVMILAAVATVFSVAGPKIMAKATNSLFDGLMKKIAGTGGIDFDYIGKILLITLGLYLFSTVVSFFQGWIMTGISQKICYRLRKDISEKIGRMPMGYSRVSPMTLIPSALLSTRA